MEETSQVDYQTLAHNLETQELESPGGIALPQVYSHLLAIYLLQNDTCNAKFLWKRIPQAIKSSTPELSQLWTIGQRLWQRDFPGLYESLNRNWSETVKPIVQEMTDLIRARAFHLVSHAYSSISIEDFVQFVGMSQTDALEAAMARGWQVDKGTNMVTPIKPVAPDDLTLTNDKQLSILTEYVSFLEN